MVNYNGTIISHSDPLFKAGNRAFLYGDQLLETISNEIEILEGEGWQFQIQDCLPWLLKKGMVFRIQKTEYHRLIKGATPLKLRICNYG